MANTLFGWANICKSGVMTASSSEPALGPTNLASDQCSPATGWQTRSGVVTPAAGASLRITASVAGSVWRVIAFVQTNMTPAASVTISLWRSGVAVATQTKIGPTRGYGQVVAVLPQAMTGDYVTADFSDPTNDQGFINVGGAFAGPAWQPNCGITWDTVYGSAAVQRRTQTYGGQEFRSLQFRQRVWKPVLDAISDADAWTQLGELDRIAALGGNVILIPDINGNTYCETVFGTLDQSGDVGFAGRLYDSRSWRTQVTERL